MRPYNRLRGILSAFKIYNCNSDVIKGELLAYSAGIELLENLIDLAENECFVSTASSCGITERESLFDEIERNTSMENRRKMLISALSINRTDFNKEGMSKFLGRYPVSFEITEHPSTNTVDVEIARNGWIIENLTHLTEDVEAFFPAHLLINIIVSGIMWQEIESRSLTFQAMDNRNYTWNSIDRLTPRIQS